MLLQAELLLATAIWLFQVPIWELYFNKIRGRNGFSSELLAFSRKYRDVKAASSELYFSMLMERAQRGLQK